jgi:hypothetical protein
MAETPVYVSHPPLLDSCKHGEKRQLAQHAHGVSISGDLAEVEMNLASRGLPPDILSCI